MTKDNYDFIDVDNRYTKELSERDKYKEEDCDFVSDLGTKANLYRGSEVVLEQLFNKLFGKNDIVKLGSLNEYAVEVVMDDGAKHHMPLFASKEQAEKFGVANNVVFDFPFTTYEGEDKVYYLPTPNCQPARHKKFFLDSLATVDANPHLNWFDFEVTANITTKQKVDAKKIALGVGKITQVVVASNRLKAEEAFEQFVDKVLNGKVIHVINVIKKRTVKPYKRKAA